MNLQLEATLLDISRKIPPDRYHDLANKLGFTFNNAESVLTTKCNNYGRAAASLLMTWTTENGTGTAQTAILKQIFESTELGGLVSTFNAEQPPSQMKTDRKLSTIFVLLEENAKFISLKPKSKIVGIMKIIFFIGVFCFIFWTCVNARVQDATRNHNCDYSTFPFTSINTTLILLPLHVVMGLC